MKGVILSFRIQHLLVFLAVLGTALGIQMYPDVFRRLSEVLASSDEEPIPVQSLERTDFRVTVRAHGEITGLQSIPIVTPRTRYGGLTMAWIIPEGSFVEEGEPVVGFDNTQARLNVEKEQSELKANSYERRILLGEQKTGSRALGIDIAEAVADYDYAMNVLPQDETIFSKWDIIEAQINAALAKKRIDVLEKKEDLQETIARSDRRILSIERDRARAEVEIALQTLDALELTAPVTGLVLYNRDRGRAPQVGDVCWRGQLLLELVDLEELQARIYVLERDGAGLEKGEPVTVRLDSIPEKSYRGVIRSAATLAQPLERDSPLRYFVCEVGIQGVGKDLKKIRPGMSLKADVVVEEYDSCFVVPASAVTFKGSENMVYVQQADDFVPRTVEIAMGPHGQVIILDGVSEGDTLALRNPFETRRLSLPDFSKGPAALDSPGSRPGPRRFRRH